MQFDCSSYVTTRIRDWLPHDHLPCTRFYDSTPLSQISARFQSTSKSKGQGSYAEVFSSLQCGVEPKKKDCNRMSLAIDLKRFNFRFTGKCKIFTRHFTTSTPYPMKITVPLSVYDIYLCFTLFAYNAKSVLSVINYSGRQHKMGAPDRITDRINRRSLSSARWRKRSRYRSIN